MRGSRRMWMLPLVVVVVAIVGAVWVATTLIDVDQTEPGKLPDVDVAIDAEAGKIPEYDVDTGEVEVGTETETVLVPEVVMVEEEVEVPTVDVEEPEDALLSEGEEDSWAKYQAIKKDLERLYNEYSNELSNEVTQEEMDWVEEQLKEADKLYNNE